MTDSSEQPETSNAQTETSNVASDEAGGQWRPSRRRVLEAGAAAGVLGGLGTLAVAGQQETYRFGGEIAAWIGQEPAAIADQENPTLELTAGVEYEVVWENLDAQPHDFVIRDADGTEITGTEIMSEQGATRSLTFTASEEMAEYICTVHPTTMVGDIEVSSGTTATPGNGTATGTATTGTADGTAAPGAGFFEEGVEVGVQEVANGPLVAPTDFAAPNGEDGRQFVTDQPGQVYVIGEDGLQEEVFADVSDRMVELGSFNGSYANPESAYDERGLLGIELHPAFGDNGRFFLHYSAPPNDETPEGWDHVEVVSEFTTTVDGLSADLETEQRLLEIQSPQYNHDGGPLAFGPDGYLYVPMGDGGGANDDMYGHVDDWYDVNSGGNGQDVTENLLGDVLRIDVDAEDGGDTPTPAGSPTPAGTPTPGGTGTPAGTGTPEGTGTPTAADVAQQAPPYGIPEDNPFAGADNPGRGEIWAYGFRNPYGISFDSAGNCFVADAGQNLWEEASVVEGGGNYGWNVTEGTHCFSTEDPADPEAVTDCPDTEPDESPYDGGPLVDPVVEYPHFYEGESVGITIVGGHRYENDTIPGLEGQYVFGTWTTDVAREVPEGRLFAADPPADFDGTGTPAGTETQAGTGTGTPTDGDTPAGTDAGTPTGTDAGTPDDTGTPEGTGTPGGTETPAPIGEEDVPRDELWDMTELVVTGGFSWFVRMFGRGAGGELYVLVNEEGVPEGETGAVLQIVPPGEGETTDGTPTGAPTETGTGTESGTDAGTEPGTDTGTPDT